MATKVFTNKKRPIRNSKKCSKSYRKPKSYKHRRLINTRKNRKSKSYVSIFSNLFKGVAK